MVSQYEKEHPGTPEGSSASEYMRETIEGAFDLNFKFNKTAEFNQFPSFVWY